MTAAAADRTPIVTFAEREDEREILGVRCRIPLGTAGALELTIQAPLFPEEGAPGAVFLGAFLAEPALDGSLFAMVTPEALEAVHAGFGALLERARLAGIVALLECTALEGAPPTAGAHVKKRIANPPCLKDCQETLSDAATCR